MYLKSCYLGKVFQQPVDCCWFPMVSSHRNDACCSMNEMFKHTTQTNQLYKQRKMWFVQTPPESIPCMFIMYLCAKLLRLVISPWQCCDCPASLQHSLIVDHDWMTHLLIYIFLQLKHYLIKRLSCFVLFHCFKHLWTSSKSGRTWGGENTIINFSLPCEKSFSITSSWCSTGMVGSVSA